MTAILIDALMNSSLLIPDKRIGPIITKAARWLRDDAVTPDGIAFRYLWGCETDPYSDSATADLNLLINHVFGAAFLFSNDTSWLDFGDRMGRHGLEHMSSNRPKQWVQSARSFGHYLAYRSLRSHSGPVLPE